MTRPEARQYVQRRLAARQASFEGGQADDETEDTAAPVCAQRPVRDSGDVDLDHMPRPQAEEYVPGVMAEPGD